MCYLLKTGMIICLVFIFKLSFAQDAGTKYTFKQVGWTIILPAGFKALDSATDAAKTARGLKAVEDANEIDVDASATRTLIAATKNGYNYFNSTITPFNTKEDGDYNVSAKSVRDMMYITIQKKMPDAKIDSVSSPQTIDGLTFHKFRVTVQIKDKVLFNMVLLSKHYKGYDFGISYVYLDEQIKEQIEEMIRLSKFNR